MLGVMSVFCSVLVWGWVGGTQLKIDTYSPATGGSQRSRREAHEVVRHNRTNHQGKTIIPAQKTH